MPDLYAHLASASLESPKTFARSVLRIAKQHLGLVAGSFYLYTSDTRTLRLKAQVGFSISNYRDFQLSLDSFPGEAIKHGGAVIDSNPLGSHMYRDKQLLEGKHVGGIVAAQLPLVDQSHPPAHGMIVPPDPIGAICLYPRKAADLKAVAQWAVDYGPFVARLYLATLERYAMYFRSAAVDNAAFRGDVGSIAYAFLNVIRSELDLSACALWRFDSRRRHLHLRRSVGEYASVADKDVPPIALSEDTVIGRCFREQSPIYHSSMHRSFTKATLPETVRRPASNAAVFPVRLPPKARPGGKRSNAAGVLALHDHTTTIDDATFCTDFSWEDSFLAEFGCEMLLVLLYQALRAGDYESDFERRMHGASTALQAARSNLQLLSARFEVATHLPVEQQHYIPNAIDWIEDLEAQISRPDLVAAEIDRRPIKLYGEVLAKIAPMVRRMAMRDRAGEFEVFGLDELGEKYHLLPEVMGDRRALDLVFRNLVENSLKYQARDAAKPNQMVIEAYADDVKSRVVVRFEDNGLGLEPEDVPFVFEDGFRGGRAAGRRPQGIGRGLYECKTILNKLGGDIVVIEPERLGGAAFRIELETSTSRRRS